MDNKGSPSSAADGQESPRKVCIICFYVVPEEADYYIFIVDLSSEGDISCGRNTDVAFDGFVSRPPTLRLNYDLLDVNGFCVLGSTLYMFENALDLTGSKDLINSMRNSKSVFTYDLSSLNVSTTFNLRLDKTKLGQAHEMLHPKRFPLGIPTPDGKRILVFSTILNDDDEYADGIDFELYDPSNGSSEGIPQICHMPRSTVEAFTFVNDDTFLLQTENGMFSLNIESPAKGWEQQLSYAGARRIPYNAGRFFVIEDLLCLTPLGAYDIQGESGLTDLFRFPLSSFAANMELPIVPYPVTPLGVKNGECEFCVIQTGIKEENRLPQMIIDVCSCDLNKYRQDREEQGDRARLETSRLKTFKFCLGAERCEQLTSWDMFSM